MKTPYEQFISDYLRDFGYQGKEIAPTMVRSYKMDDIDGRQLRKPLK